jgi:putative DNA primase/helicase
MRESIIDRAQGRWHGVLSALGIPAAALRNKHQPCPMCGGKDRYRFDDKEGRGSYFCSQCGAGNGIDLLMKFHGWDFKQAAEKIETVVGKVKPSPPPQDRTDEATRSALRHLWQSCVPATADDPVGRWLERRVGKIEIPPCLAFAPRVRYAADPPTFHPCMVALVSAPNGRHATLHRTYLTEDGQKAPVEAPRRLMPGKVPEGAAIRLSPLAATLGIAEGIETALAAWILFKVPCWAAISDIGLQKWIPPTEVERVLIFSDRDEGFAGQAAAYALAKRLSRTLAVSVEIPTNLKDWNDVLLWETGRETVAPGYPRVES